MSIQIKNYEASKGQDWPLQITFKDASKVAIDITDYTIFFTIKKKKYIDDINDDNAAIVKTITDHTTPLEGITDISLSAEETEALKGPYCYDVKYKKANGKKFYIMKGSFSILKNSTRRIS